MNDRYIHSKTLSALVAALLLAPLSAWTVAPAKVSIGVSLAYDSGYASLDHASNASQ